MTNEISINWNNNQSTERPIFEMFDDSEFESIQQEAMALYGEACYVQESYEEYILEAAKSDEPSTAQSVGRLIKNLIDRFIRAIGRFLTNQACKKAVAYFGESKNRKDVKAYTEYKWPIKKCDPEYTLAAAVFRMNLIMRHIVFYKSIMETNDPKELEKKLKNFNLITSDTGHFTITDVTPNEYFKYLDKMFIDGTVNGSGMTLKDVIKTLEKFNTYWSPFDSKDSKMVEMITTDIKSFAQFQSELLEAYKFFKSNNKEK